MRILVIVIALLSAQLWPDGTPVDKWFSQEVKTLKGKEAKRFVITDFGAVPDSALVQTECIQKAIDAAARKGGTVVIPEGVWLSGALFFKPRTHLFLEKGAVLKGSTDNADYPDVPVHIEGVLQPYSAALVNAEGCDGFSIRGSGTLDGDGLPYWKAFWARRKENPACTNLEVRRPRMISVSHSADVTIEGVGLRNSAFWNVHLYKCRRVLVSGVDIYAPISPVKAPSSDGIDLDACEDVHIVGSSFATGDDLIALKGGKGPWADSDPDNGGNARILVEDCFFGHGPGAVVFGSECIRAENVIVRRCKAKGTDRLLWLKMRPDTPQNYSHILLEDVDADVKYGIYVKPWTQFFDLKGRKDIPMSFASDIRLSRCTVKSRRVKNIVSAPEQYRIDGLEISDCKIKYSYNKEESKVKPYTLPDPLVFADGRAVCSPEEWPSRRREILDLFQKEMYGEMPPARPFYLTTIEEGVTMGRTALRRQVRMSFSPDGGGPHIDWLIIYPKDVSGAVPAVLSLNYYGNHTVIPDKEVLIPECWLDDSEQYGIVSNRATEAGRGVLAGRGTDTVYPVDELVAKGYAFVTACYGDVCGDPEDMSLQGSVARNGVYSLWPKDISTGALMAWAWAICRGMDMLEMDGAIDASRVVVAGCSRLGKATLLAGAFDERFPVVVVNQSGGGGVPLSKRNLGESIGTETEKFSHWWSPEFRKYAGNEAAMPFDQHLLLSCIAPRALLVEGFNNPWFDTYGEFLSLKASSPVWTFLGGEGLPEVPWPEIYDTSAIGRDLGYVRRRHGHGLSPIDWEWLLDFSDKVFGR